MKSKKEQEKEEEAEWLASDVQNERGRVHEGMRYAVRLKTKGGELDDSPLYGEKMKVMNSFRKRKKLPDKTTCQHAQTADNQSNHDHEHMQEKCLDSAWQKKSRTGNHWPCGRRSSWTSVFHRGCLHNRRVRDPSVCEKPRSSDHHLNRGGQRDSWWNRMRCHVLCCSFRCC